MDIWTTFFAQMPHIWPIIGELILPNMLMTSCFIVLLVVLFQSAFGQEREIGPLIYRFAISVVLLAPLPGQSLPLGLHGLHNMLQASLNLTSAFRSQQVDPYHSVSFDQVALAHLEAGQELPRAMVVEACRIMAINKEYCGQAFMLRMDEEVSVLGQRLVDNFYPSLHSLSVLLADMVRFQGQADYQKLAYLRLQTQDILEQSLLQARGQLLSLQPQAQEFHWYRYPMQRFVGMSNNGDQLLRRMALKPNWPIIDDQQLARAGLTYTQIQRLRGLTQLSQSPDAVPIYQPDPYGDWTLKIDQFMETQNDFGAQLIKVILQEFTQQIGVQGFIGRATHTGLLIINLSSQWLKGVHLSQWIQRFGLSSMSPFMGSAAVKWLEPQERTDIGAMLSLMLPEKSWALALLIFGAFLAFAIPIALQTVWAFLTLTMFLGFVSLCLLLPMLPLSKRVLDQAMVISVTILLAPLAMLLFVDMLEGISWFLDMAILEPLTQILPLAANPVAMLSLLVMIFLAQMRLLLWMIHRLRETSIFWWRQTHVF